MTTLMHAKPDIWGAQQTKSEEQKPHADMGTDSLLACNACMRAPLAALVPHSTAPRLWQPLPPSAAALLSAAKQCMKQVACRWVTKHWQFSWISLCLRSKMCAGNMGLDLYSGLCIFHDTVCTTQVLVNLMLLIAQLNSSIC